MAQMTNMIVGRVFIDLTFPSILSENRHGNKKALSRIVLKS